MSKNALPELEKRVARLEEEFRALKAQLADSRGPDKASWERIVGSFEGDEAFQQIVREGQKLREADREATQNSNGTRAKRDRRGTPRKAPQAR